MPSSIATGMIVGAGLGLGVTSMAPEYFSPVGEPDRRADLYSVGAMLYEALTEKDYPGAGVYVAEEDGTQRLLSREESLKVLQRSVDLAKAHGISLDD